MSKFKGRVSRFFNFQEPRQAFGVLLDGPTIKDLYLMILAVSIAMVFSVITGFPFSSPIWTAFIKEELKFSDALYGLLSALPWIMVAVQIPFSSYINRNPKIKRLFIPMLFTMRISFVLLGVLAAFINNDLLLMATAFMFFFMALASAVTWMCDLMFNIWLGAAVPPSCSGRYLGNRQSAISLMTLIYSLLISVLTDQLGDWQYKYTLLFILAAIFGSMDALVFIWVRRPQEAYSPLPEGPIETSRTTTSDRAATQLGGRRFPRFTSHIFEPLQDKRYQTYLLFTTLYSFGMQISSPFVNVYMLEVLKLPVGIQTFLAILVPGAATVLFIGQTGRISDRYGYRNALLLFGFLSAVSPIPWLFVHQPTWWLIIPINFAWGITGVATDLAIMSMSIFLAPAEKRSRYITSKAIFQNIFGIVPGILLGGFLSDALVKPLLHAGLSFPGGFPVRPYHVLMVLALIFRTAAILIFVRRLPNDSRYTFKQFLRALFLGIQRKLTRKEQRLRVRQAEGLPDYEAPEPKVFIDPESSLDLSSDGQAHSSDRPKSAPPKH